MGRPIVALTEIADRVRAGAPRLGGTRLVCIDGPSGAGKSVLAAALAPYLHPAVVHMDDLYPGWDGLAAAVPLLVAAVLEPLSESRAGRYRRYDWDAGTYAEEHAVPDGGTLIVEGVASGARAAARWASLLIWVDAPADVRFARGLDRDGPAYAPHWRRWAR